ncbi:MAG: hypothetical protein JXK07_03660 [Spirochaetes bacterium]|nr:hypothetical protein [Spirochaetota bacterium]MBN2770672.1 hypothetical protein [Spirochaetota bacterium]HRX17006.1 hypothetical protein [Spirochaetota bacterium]
MFYYNEQILKDYRDSNIKCRMDLYEKYPYMREIFNSIDLEECAARKIEKLKKEKVATV